MRRTSQIDAAFIPLSDSAPLIVAHELGFAEAEGIALNLIRERSWATVRDRFSVGHIDVAHALAPMPLAANLGLGPLEHHLVAPMSLGFGGNTVVVSRALWKEMQAAGALDSFDAGVALQRLSQAFRARGGAEARLRFAIVHPYSAHRYELAYWLAAGGLMPKRDVEFVVLPPSLMAAALGAGRIDGFCAGEPWGTIACAESAGHILTTKPHIWRSSPEKVLAVSQKWADADVDRLHGLVRAIYHACCWCDVTANHDALTDILSRPDYLNRPANVIRPGLQRRLPRTDLGADTVSGEIDGFLNFSSRAATFPWVSHALWLYTQMVRWCDVVAGPQVEAIARQTFRPNIYRAALSPLGIAMPSANAKVEGALGEEIVVGSADGSLTLGPDGFFDGLTFDPDQIGTYVEGLRAHDRAKHST